MRPNVFLLVLLAAATLADARQTAPLGSPPRIEIDVREVDFGTLQRGSEAVAEVELGNSGGRPLEILEVVSGCGCTVVDAPAKIPRGGSGTLRVILDTTGQDENLRSGVTLTTNDPRNRLVHIRLRARLLIGIELLPSASLQMSAGRAFRGTGARVVRRLPGVDGELLVDEVTTDRPWLAASARRVDVASGAAGDLPALLPGDWIVEARLTGVPIAAPHEAFVAFATGLEREPRGGFAVRVSVPRAINVEPAALTLTPAGDATVRGEVLVAVRPDLAQWPLTAAIEAPGFSATPASAGSRYYKVAVEWDPAAAGAVPEAQLTLTVGGESVIVPVRVGGG